MDETLPTRSEAESDPDRFYELLKKVLKRGYLRRTQLADELGVDKSTVTRMIEQRRFDRDQSKIVLDYMFEHGRVISGHWRERAEEFPDFLHFAFLQFFDIKETSQDNARAAIEGTYQLWRYSVENDDEFVCGKIVFKTVPRSGAISVRMIQPKKQTKDIRGSVEEFRGYFFRIADMYAMILKDQANNDLRITIFPRFRLEKIGKHIDKDSAFPENTLHIVHMDGFGLGIDGNNLFFSPVHCSLVDNIKMLQELDSRLDVVAEEDVPPRVLKRLRKYSRIVK